ncbi:hypothetical protein MA4S0726RB_3881 [Mycobacteroides abscessus 4S-0726-RB]|nr:hypothetical protein MA4S0726RB_3881 [Mycobacteroides abscessus 4S-0726-RB]
MLSAYTWHWTATGPSPGSAEAIGAANTDTAKPNPAAIEQIVRMVLLLSV